MQENYCNVMYYLLYHSQGALIIGGDGKKSNTKVEIYNPEFEEVCIVYSVKSNVSNNWHTFPFHLSDLLRCMR